MIQLTDTFLFWFVAVGLVYLTIITYRWQKDIDRVNSAKEIDDERKILSAQYSSKIAAIKQEIPWTTQFNKLKDEIEDLREKLKANDDKQYQKIIDDLKKMELKKEGK